jgi:putative tryptophan/tyrosine transport system ATP-binding protein
MILITGASKTFNRGSANEIKALREIDITIPNGEFIVVLGSNGSGKSTLLNAVAGNLILDSGKITIDNIDVTTWKDYERSKFVSRIFQNPLSGTAPDLSILDNFRLAALRCHSKTLRLGIDADFKKRVKEKIAFLKMGLENKLEQNMGLLSGGQRQALTLLMAVMDDTKVLLLDEPTAALDPKSSETVIEIARKLVEEYKLTTLLVTHEIKFAQRLGTRVIQLEEGKIIRDVAAIKKQQSTVQDYYSWFS